MSNHEGPQRRQILEEEDYTASLTHIVTRDYYPALPTLRRDAAILEARGRGDIAAAVALRRAAREEDREQERARQEDAEHDREVLQIRDAENVTHVRKKPRPLAHESVTGFHARVTSEDNAEFEANQERERREREKILGVVYAARADATGRLMIEACVNGEDGGGDVSKKSIAPNELGLASDLYDAPPSAGLRITAGDDSGASEKRMLQLTDDDNGCAADKPANSNGIAGRNGLFFQPQHHSQSRLTNGTSSGTGTFLALTNNDAAEEGDGNVNNAGGTVLALTNKDVAEGDRNLTNTDMPPPPPRKPVSDQPSIDGRCQLVEYLPKPLLPDIHPPATRFSYQEESRLLANKIIHGVPLSGSHLSSASSYAGATASDTTDLDASPPPLDRERDARRRARQREHETFVPMTPLIRPGGGGDGSAGSGEPAPLMTWGDVASTPLVLGSGAAADGRGAEWEPSRPPSPSTSAGGTASGPAFDVADHTRRETMARVAERGLADRARTYRAAGSRRGSRKRGKDADDEASVRSSRSSWSAASAASQGRAASLTPAARALLEASHAAQRRSSEKRSGSHRRRSASSSRIFAKASSGAAGRLHAGARDSFGSALRLSYSATPQSRHGSGRRRGSSVAGSSVAGSSVAGSLVAGSSVASSVIRAGGGATPQNHSLG